MNKTRTNRVGKVVGKLEDIKSELESIRDEEQDWYDGHVSDAWQDSDAAAESEDAISAMDDASDYIGDAIDALADLCQ